MVSTSSTTPSAEILNDAIVDDSNLCAGMRMCITLGRCTVGRPTGMANANAAIKRLVIQTVFEVAELAFSAAAFQLMAFKRGDTG